MAVCDSWSFQPLLPLTSPTLSLVSLTQSRRAQPIHCSPRFCRVALPASKPASLRLTPASCSAPARALRSCSSDAPLPGAWTDTGWGVLCAPWSRRLSNATGLVSSHPSALLESCSQTLGRHSRRAAAGQAPWEGMVLACFATGQECFLIP